MIMKQEFLRKAIHFSSLIYPALYYFYLTKLEISLLTLVIFIFLLCVDILRMKRPNIRAFFNKFFSFVSRSNEVTGGFYGSTYFMLGAFLSFALFTKEIAIAAILVLVISDALASLVGKSVGGRKLSLEKTLSGFLAFLISASVISALFNPLFIIPAIFASFAELYAKKLKLDDNLIIPLVYGFVASIIILL